MSLRCLEWAEETREECAEWRDEGYSTCSEYQDQGYNSCSSWGWFSWLCIAWYWVTNLVCIAWYWVANVVCVAWTYVVSLVCLIWETVKAIVQVIGGIIAFILEMIYSIPFIGGVIKELVTGITDVFWRVVGAIGALVDVTGWYVAKRLQILVFILKDEKGTPVATHEVVISDIQKMIDSYKDQANINVMRMEQPYSDNATDLNSWIIDLSVDESKGILDVDCGAGAIGEDLSIQGSKFNWLITKYGYYGNVRRTTGYGAPIFVFVVRTTDSVTGCSLNILSDYVTIGKFPATGNFFSIAHECGHSCGLADAGGLDNMMYNGPDDTYVKSQLTKVQEIWMRNSRHVTLL